MPVCRVMTGQTSGSNVCAAAFCSAAPAVCIWERAAALNALPRNTRRFIMAHPPRSVRWCAYTLLAAPFTSTSVSGDNPTPQLFNLPYQLLKCTFLRLLSSGVDRFFRGPEGRALLFHGGGFRNAINESRAHIKDCSGSCGGDLRFLVGQET